MRRTLATLLVAGAALVAAPATAEAATCIPLNRHTGTCVFGDGWVVCAYDRGAEPALYVYVPGETAHSEHCGTW